LVFQTDVAPKIVFVLGLTNLLSGLYVLFTCRCVPGWRFARSLMQRPWYQRLFKWHGKIWWVFWVSVMVHAVFAIGYYGRPF
jgi:hypothetical protein